MVLKKNQFCCTLVYAKTLVLFAVNQMNGESSTILGGPCLLGKLTVFLCIAVAVCICIKIQFNAI